MIPAHVSMSFEQVARIVDKNRRWLEHKRDLKAWCDATNAVIAPVVAKPVQIPDSSLPHLNGYPLCTIDPEALRENGEDWSTRPTPPVPVLEALFPALKARCALGTLGCPGRLTHGPFSSCSSGCDLSAVRVVRSLVLRVPA